MSDDKHMLEKLVVTIVALVIVAGVVIAITL